MKDWDLHRQVHLPGSRRSEHPVVKESLLPEIRGGSRRAPQNGQQYLDSSFEHMQRQLPEPEVQWERMSNQYGGGAANTRQAALKYLEQFKQEESKAQIN